MKKIFNIEKQIFNKVTNLYILFIILVFPLLIDSSGYYHIFELKWYSFTIVTIIYLFICLLIFNYFLIIKKVNYLEFVKLNIIHKLALLFLAINFISFFLSPYLNNYNLFIGVGRGEGLLTSSLYILSFLFVSLFGSFNIKYFKYISITSIIISIFAILQYLGFNPFHMYKDIIGIRNISYYSSIGNVDTLSALYCILLPISCCSYIFIKDLDIKDKIIHLLSIFFGMFIINIINVDGGIVALISTLTIVFPFIISNNKYFSKLLIVISIVLLGIGINMILNPQYHFDIDRFGFYFQFNIIIFSILFISLILCILSNILSKYNYNRVNDKKFIRNIYIIIGCSIILFLIFVYFYNFKSGLLYELHELLNGNFDDSFGSYRIFLWKRSMRIYSQYPIFGSGPDTFSIRFMDKFTNDLLAIGPLTINDTAANIYITMLINIGIVGLVSYLLFIIFLIINGIKKRNINLYIIMISIICYLIQSFFNLSVVIVTPIFWIILAIYYLCIKNIE